MPRTSTVLALILGVVLAAPVLAPAPVAAQSPAPAATAVKATSAAPLNLNTATADQLDGLPGVGKAMATRILEYRQKQGGFKKIEELMNVKGIGEKNFLKLKPLVTVAAAKTAPGSEPGR